MAWHNCWKPGPDSRSQVAAFPVRLPQQGHGRLLDTIARHDNICKYLDMPLQHASGAVLKRMRRGGNADIFLKTIERVRSTVPGVAIRSTFITGFPGETEADFAVLSDFVRAAQLDWLGVFSYSDEEGSGAFDLERESARPDHRGTPPLPDAPTTGDQPKIPSSPR